jgi:hypothetical protein
MRLFQCSGFGLQFSRFGFLFSAFSFLVSTPSRAQEALRQSLTGQTVSAERQRDLKEKPYTVRWGDFQLLAGASLAGEWNDNVNLSHTDPKEDFIITPMVNLDALWPITELNSLTFSLGVGYATYIEHSQYDYAVITPGSQLAWDIYVKDFHINFHDWFYYQEDPTIYGGVSGTARFGGFYNTAGVLTTWDLRDVVLSLGYDHFNFIASSSTYDYLTRASDFFVARAGFHVHPSATVGLEASGGPTAYDQPILSPNLTYSFGAFGDWKATEHIRLQPRAGYYQYFFSNEGLVGADTEESGYYLSLKLIHDLKWNVDYSLEGGHESFLGNQSSLTVQWYAALWVNWRMIKNISLSTGLRYENATQPVGQLADNYERVFASLRLSCPIKPKLTASLEYRYWLRDSAVTVDNNYEQNRVALQLAYHF